MKQLNGYEILSKCSVCGYMKPEDRERYEENPDIFVLSHGYCNRAIDVLNHCGDESGLNKLITSKRTLITARHEQERLEDCLKQGSISQKAFDAYMEGLRQRVIDILTT